MRWSRPAAARPRTPLALSPNRLSWVRETTPYWRSATRAITMSSGGSARNVPHEDALCGTPSMPGQHAGPPPTCGLQALRNRCHAVTLRHELHDVAHDAADLEVLRRVDARHPSLEQGRLVG